MIKVMTREEEIKQAAYSRYAIVSSPVVFKAQCNCFIEGAIWSDKTLLDKASEWLKKNISNYINWEYNEFQQCFEYDGSFDIEKMISDFRKEMEE